VSLNWKNRKRAKMHTSIALFQPDALCSALTASLRIFQLERFLQIKLVAAVLRTAIVERRATVEAAAMRFSELTNKLAVDRLSWNAATP
jgi:hypothetical protein